jgi:hypothetical protein
MGMTTALPDKPATKSDPEISLHGYPVDFVCHPRDTSESHAIVIFVSSTLAAITVMEQPSEIPINTRPVIVVCDFLGYLP